MKLKLVLFCDHSDLSGLQPGVLKCEIRLDPLSPLAIEVEEHIGSTLEVWCCQPGLLMPLKPREVLGVIAPGELLELLCSQVLMIGPLLVVERPEQSVLIKPFEERRLLEASDRVRGVKRFALAIILHVKLLRLVLPVPSNVPGLGHVPCRRL